MAFKRSREVATRGAVRRRACQLHSIRLLYERFKNNQVLLMLLARYHRLTLKWLNYVMTISPVRKRQCGQEILEAKRELRFVLDKRECVHYTNIICLRGPADILRR